MKKTLTALGKATKAIRLINAGSTWEEAAAAADFSVPYLRKLVKSQYTREGDYRRLCTKAKANKKAKADIATTLGDDKEEKEVIVVETGFLLSKGIQGIFGEILDVYIPWFCIKELEKLSNVSEDAAKILQFYYGVNRITPIKLTKETLIEDPSYPVKLRTCGIVAVCCELWSMGYHVRLLTNSLEVSDLAKYQNCGIEVIRVPPVATVVQG